MKRRINIEDGSGNFKFEGGKMIPDIKQTEAYNRFWRVEISPDGNINQFPVTDLSWLDDYFTFFPEGSMPELPSHGTVCRETDLRERRKILIKRVVDDIDKALIEFKSIIEGKEKLLNFL